MTSAISCSIAPSLTKEVNLYVPLFEGLLAQIEARHDAEGALTRIDEALALAAETGEHWCDAFLHRLRGEILLKRDSANAALAEDALLAGIAIVQQQKAGSLELRAALDLVRLYSSTSRHADARALLASVLKGFLPTRKFRRSRKAQTILATLTS
jgi:predicted ATPase